MVSNESARLWDDQTPACLIAWLSRTFSVLSCLAVCESRHWAMAALHGPCAEE